MATLNTITVPNPFDVNATDLPIFDGDLTGAGNVLADGTYIATRECIEDGDPYAPERGTLTVADGTATFRPFARTPETVIGVRDADGDTLCSAECPMLPEGEHVNDLTDATVGSNTDGDRTMCCCCGGTLLDYDHDGATFDVVYALRAAGAVAGELEGTGGNCQRVAATLPDGRRVWVTDGDAFRPDGIGMWAAIATADDDENPVVLIDGPHNPVGLYRSVIAALTA